MPLLRSRHNEEKHLCLVLRIDEQPAPRQIVDRWPHARPAPQRLVKRRDEMRRRDGLCRLAIATVQ